MIRQIKSEIDQIQSEIDPIRILIKSVARNRGLQISGSESRLGELRLRKFSEKKPASEKNEESEVADDHKASRTF